MLFTVSLNTTPLWVAVSVVWEVRRLSLAKNL